MGNGGWYGTEEEWHRIESPLKALDANLEAFATRHGFSITKNHKSWPERSMRWGETVQCLIQIFLNNEETLSLNFWICVSQDRGDSRYWRQEMLSENAPASEIQARLTELLASALQKVSVWSADPETLEFATKIG